MCGISHYPSHSHSHCRYPSHYPHHSFPFPLSFAFSVSFSSRIWFSGPGQEEDDEEEETIQLHTRFFRWLHPIMTSIKKGVSMAGLFGTDGVRARINTGSMTAEAVVRLALAAGRWFARDADRALRPQPGKAVAERPHRIR